MELTLRVKMNRFAELISKSIEVNAEWKHLVERVAGKYIGNRLPPEYIKALEPFTLKVYAVTQIMLDKFPDFIINNELKLEDVCRILNIGVDDLLREEAQRIFETEVALQRYFSSSERDEFTDHCLAVEISLREKGLSSKLLELFKPVISFNKFMQITFDRACEAVEKYALTPLELSVLASLSLGEKDVLLVKNLSADQIKKIDLLYRYNLADKIRTAEDLNDALKVADTKILDRYAEFISNMDKLSSTIMESYGTFKILDAISRYSWNEKSSKAFTLQLFKENGLFAKYDNDLDRLAKIALDAGLNETWKQKFMDCRHSPKEWIELQQEFKAQEGGFYKWLSDGPYAKIDEIWPEVNSELVDNNLITDLGV